MKTPPQVRAVIFDMDGLMLDTEIVYKHTMFQTASDFGCVMSDDDFLATLGVRSADCRHIIANIVGETRVDDFFARWRVNEAAYSAANAIEKKPGIDTLLGYLTGRGVPIIVATSTRRPRALARLESTGLLLFFPTLVCGDDITHGKPAPDIFLAAARALDVAPEHCLVLEDSEAGTRAAHAARCPVIIIPDLKQPSPEVAALALAVLPSLNEAEYFLKTLLPPN